MTSHEKIPYPSDDEIERQIRQIVGKGVVKRKSFLSELVALQRNVGWQMLLPNKNENVFTVIIVMAILLLEWLALGSLDEPKLNYLLLFFMISPFIFASLSIYSFYEKQENQTFELEMTTKYTVFQLIGLRMLFFSFFAILLNTSLSFLFMSTLDIGFWRLWLISLTSLFLFAVGMLYVLKSGRAVRRMLVYSFGWIITNVLCMNYANDIIVQFLLQLPLVVYIMLLMTFIWLFIFNFKNFYLRKQEGIFTC